MCTLMLIQLLLAIWFFARLLLLLDTMDQTGGSEASGSFCYPFFLFFVPALLSTATDLAHPSLYSTIPLVLFFYRRTIGKGNSTLAATAADFYKLSFLYIYTSFFIIIVKYTIFKQVENRTIDQANCDTAIYFRSKNEFFKITVLALSSSNVVLRQTDCC